MREVRAIGVGLLGCGTVGGTLIRTLLSDRERLLRETGLDFVPRRIVVRDAGKPRDRVPAELLSTRREDLLASEIQVVVEVAGGDGADLRHPYTRASRWEARCHSEQGSGQQARGRAARSRAEAPPVADQAGVIGEVTLILGSRGMSIQSVHAGVGSGSSGEGILEILTDASREGDVADAVEACEVLAQVLGPCRRIRCL